MLESLQDESLGVTENGFWGGRRKGRAAGEPASPLTERCRETEASPRDQGPPVHLAARGCLQSFRSEVLRTVHRAATQLLTAASHKFPRGHQCQRLFPVGVAVPYWILQACWSDGRGTLLLKKCFVIV